MLYVACPSCGERGKIPPTLVGARIKCKKCGISFNVAPSAAKAPAVEGTAVAAVRQRHRPPEQPTGGIAVDGLEASAWAVSSDQPPDLLKAEADAGLSESAEATHAFEAPNSTGFKEYKVLWSRDKLFEGKFDVARLEEALNRGVTEFLCKFATLCLCKCPEPYSRVSACFAQQSPNRSPKCSCSLCQLT